jgi:exportin-2 (importin alpha re-exporter)
MKFVMNEFAAPYMKFFQAIDSLVDTNTQNTQNLHKLMEIVLLLIKIFHDLNCQDLPEFFEDNQDQFMLLFHKYLTYSNPNFISSETDEAGVLEKVKSAICEVIDLYARMYEEDFKHLPGFVQTVWTLLTSTSIEPKNDIVF